MSTLALNTTLSRHATPAHDLAVSRTARVRRLLGLTILLSAVDLALTLHAMTTTGMFEDNPLVRVLIAWAGSAWPIVGLKLATVAFAVGIVDRLRTRRPAELGAWIMMLVLAWVTVRWGMYLQVTAELNELTLHAAQLDRSWTKIG